MHRDAKETTMMTSEINRRMDEMEIGTTVFINGRSVTRTALYLFIVRDADRPRSSWKPVDRDVARDIIED